MFGFGRVSVEKQLFNLKFTAKQMDKMATKTTKKEREEVRDRMRPSPAGRRLQFSGLSDVARAASRVVKRVRCSPAVSHLVRFRDLRGGAGVLQWLQFATMLRQCPVRRNLRE